VDADHHQRVAHAAIGSVAPTTNAYTAPNVPVTNRNLNSTYDNAGNLTVFASANISYDANNLQTRRDRTLTPTMASANACLEPSGARPTTYYVYDAFGQLSAEYTAAPLTIDRCVTCYLSYDHLGSPRMVTDPAAQIVALHDYAPFGQEIPAGVDGRTTLWGASDNVNQKFTGQERDSETNLDFFQARYMSSGLGRFMSPDPYNAGADLTNPQSWNGYAYVIGNPLNGVDPSGTDRIDCGGVQADACVTATPDPVDTTLFDDWWWNGTANVCAECVFHGDSVTTPLPTPAKQGQFVYLASDGSSIENMTCPAVPFKITGIAPKQAPNAGAFSQAKPQIGDVAIKPQNFGVPYGTVAQRNAAQSNPIRSTLRGIKIFPDYDTAAPTPGAPKTPVGLPSNGPYSPADAIGPAEVRNQPGNQIDLYRYPTLTDAYPKHQNNPANDNNSVKYSRGRMPALRITLTILLGLATATAVTPQCSESGLRLFKTAQASSACLDDVVRVNHFKSPDGKKTLLVDRNGFRLLAEEGKALRWPSPLEFDGPVEVAWSPDSKAFFVNEGHGSGLDGWTVRIFRILHGSVVASKDLNRPLATSFKSLLNCGPRATNPNIKGVGWSRRGTRVFLVIQPTVHASCGTQGTFRGAIVDVDSGSAGELYSQRDAIRLFGAALAPEMR
jgi:RHS repeat-associated protein